MPRILRTRQSRVDVVEIVLRVRRDNRRVARRLLKSINDTIELLAGFADRDPRGAGPIHLAGAGAQQHAVLRHHDRVALHVLADQPGEFQI